MGFIKPKGYSPDEFRQFVGMLKFSAWKPKFITLHNTAEPSLAQWHNGFTSYIKSGKLQRAGIDPAKTSPAAMQYYYEEWRCSNLNDYYQHQLRWHAGPHLFISPSYIWNTCDLTRSGVHCSCFNSLSIGIEMVGDYGTEPFTTGDGVQVRALTIEALAILHNRLQISPLPYKVGALGLHAHKACVRDHHDCPGKHVDMDDMRRCVMNMMKEYNGKELQHGNAA